MQCFCFWNKLNQKFSCQGPLTCFRSFQSHLMVLEVQFSLSWVLTSIPFLLTMHHIFILFFLPFTSNPTLHLRWWCRSLRVGHLSQSYWRKSENWQKIRINSYIADFQTTLLLWMYRLCFAIVNNYFFIKTFSEMLSNLNHVVIFTFTQTHNQNIHNFKDHVLYGHTLVLNFTFQMSFTCNCQIFHIWKSYNQHAFLMKTNFNFMVYVLNQLCTIIGCTKY